MIPSWHTSPSDLLMPLVDQGFFVYSVRVEALSGKVYDLVTHIIVTCNDKNYIVSVE